MPIRRGLFGYSLLVKLLITPSKLYDFVELITSILLLSVALWLLNFLGKIIVSEVFKLAGQNNSRSAVKSSNPSSRSSSDEFNKSSTINKKIVSRLKSAETHIDGNNYSSALKELKNSLILDYKSISKSPSSVYEHNQLNLSLLLRLADAQNLRLENLPIVEQLVGELEGIDKELAKAEASFKSLKKKRKEASKDIPNWSKDEFENSLNSLREDRKNTLKTLNQQLKELYKSLEKPEKGGSTTETVTYH